MTDTLLRPGGPSTPDEFIVTADQVTILGDGTTQRPLHTSPEGVTVTTDGVTILGNGTLASPLRTNPDGVPVAADGVTILGNGTLADPLRTNPDGVSVATDGDTILGNGTLVDPIRMAIPLVAAAQLEGFGGLTPGIEFHSNSGFTSATRSGQGVYTLTLDDPPGQAQTVALATRGVSQAGSITATVLVDETIQINAFDSTNAPQDITFSIAVFSATLV